jgi:hypothetical protein
MLAVVAAALFFALEAHIGRLVRLNNYDAVQSSVAATNRSWHLHEHERYYAALIVNETRAAILMFAFLTLLVIAVAGRVLNRLNRRSVERERGDVAGSPTPGTGQPAGG